LGTYVIANYGGVAIGPLVLALLTAAFGNFVPAIILANALKELVKGDPKHALTAIQTESKNVHSFAFAPRIEDSDPTTSNSSNPDGYVALPVASEPPDTVLSMQHQ
jgi:hypothetical protein